MINYARWYINITRWRPTREQWLHLTSSLGEVEVTRINKFNFKEDAKASLIGQALIRKLVSKATGKPSYEIKLTRTDLGRPVVCKSYVEQCGSSWPSLLDFNVSHSGDYCVLAGIWSCDKDSPQITVGVDVTKIVKKQTKQELDRFLDLMSRREFNKSEWLTVEQAPTDRQKCVNFTRLWCLKESFIKSIGLGLTFKLDRITFQPIDTTMDRLRKKLISGTTVILDDSPASDWHFQEMALDEDHLLAVGYHLQHTNLHKLTDLIEDSPFVEISIDSLAQSLSPIIEPDEDDWIKFSRRTSRE